MNLLKLLEHDSGQCQPNVIGKHIRCRYSKLSYCDQLTCDSCIMDKSRVLDDNDPTEVLDNLLKVVVL